MPRDERKPAATGELNDWRTWFKITRYWIFAAVVLVGLLAVLGVLFILLGGFDFHIDRRRARRNPLTPCEARATVVRTDRDRLRAGEVEVEDGVFEGGTDLTAVRAEDAEGDLIPDDRPVGCRCKKW